MSDIIRIEHLNKSFGDVRAVMTEFPGEAGRVVCVSWCEWGRKEYHDFYYLWAAPEG